MKNFVRNEMIKIGRQEYNISEVTKILAKLPSTVVVALFKGKKQFIDRSMLMEVLKCVLKDSVYDYRVKHKKSSQELAYRLNYYKNFSQTQLVNLLMTLDFRRKLSLHLYNDIWYLLLGVLDEAGASSSDLKAIYKRAELYKGTNQETVKEYMDNISQLFYDRPGYFDGVLIEDLKENLLHSSTITEVREIASIYGISIPKRIKKNELIKLILEELTARNEDTTGVEEKLKNTSIVLIQRYCKDNKINASVELKKKDVIDYLMKNINLDQALSQNVITGEFVMPQRSIISDEEFYSIKTEYDPNAVVEEEDLIVDENVEEVIEEFDEDPIVQVKNVVEGAVVDNKILEKIADRLDALYELLLSQNVKTQVVEEKVEEVKEENNEVVEEVKEEKPRKKGFFGKLIKFLIIFSLIVVLLTFVFYFVVKLFINQDVLPEFINNSLNHIDAFFNYWGIPIPKKII